MILFLLAFATAETPFITGEAPSTSQPRKAKKRATTSENRANLTKHHSPGFETRDHLIAKMTGTNGSSNGGARVGTTTVKQGLAQMLKGGVIVSSDSCYPRLYESWNSSTSNFRLDWRCCCCCCSDVLADIVTL